LLNCIEGVLMQLATEKFSAAGTEEPGSRSAAAFQFAFNQT